MSYSTGLGFTPIFQIDQGDNDITGSFQDRLISIYDNGGGSSGSGSTKTAASSVTG